MWAPHFMLSSHRYGAFIQDNWHASRKLTVNLGFRYDLEIPYTDRFNQDEWFNPTLAVGITGAPIDPATWPSILGPVPHYSDHPVGALEFMGHDPRTIGPRKPVLQGLRTALWPRLPAEG